MKRIYMTFVQIETMVAHADGYDSVTEWREDCGAEYTSIYDLVDVENMGFSRDGAKWYAFEDTKGRPCIYYKY